MLARLPALVLSLAFALTALAPSALADDIERELPSVRIQVADGAPGVKRAGSKVVGMRYANLKRGQRIDFFATGRGGDFVLRVLDPSGKALFDAPQLADGTNKALKIYTYGFQWKAAKKGRYIIQFIADAKSSVTVTSDGFLAKVEKVTIPGTWTLDYETLAFDVLNLQGKGLENLERMAKTLERQVKLRMTFHKDGTWSGTIGQGRRAETKAGRWSLRGKTLTIKTLSAQGKALDKDKQTTEYATFEDGQIVVSKGEAKAPIPFTLDKIA